MSERKEFAYLQDKLNRAVVTFLSEKVRNWQRIIERQVLTLRFFYNSRSRSERQLVENQFFQRKPKSGSYVGGAFSQASLAILACLALGMIFVFKKVTPNANPDKNVNARAAQVEVLMVKVPEMELIFWSWVQMGESVKIVLRRGRTLLWY